MKWIPLHPEEPHDRGRYDIIIKVEGRLVVVTDTEYRAFGGEFHKGSTKYPVPEVLSFRETREVKGYVPPVEELLARRRQRIIGRFIAAPPTVDLCRSDYFTSDEEKERLQDFVCDNLRAVFAYMTGVGVIEIAWKLAESQIDNGDDQEAERVARDSGYDSIFG